MNEQFTIQKSEFVKLEGNAIKFVNFQPGSVIAFRYIDEHVINLSLLLNEINILNSILFM